MAVESMELAQTLVEDDDDDEDDGSKAVASKQQGRWS